MDRTQSAGQTVGEAVRVFSTFGSGRPKAWPTGIAGVDTGIGGLYPGAAGVIGAATGVGKTSIMLAAAMERAEAGLRTVLVSSEDGPDVLGTRILSHLTGINSLRIRTKDLTPAEVVRLKAGAEQASALPIEISYARTLTGAEEDIKTLAGADTLVWVDYLQKFRGASDNRRGEVGGTLTRLSNAAWDGGMPVMFLSQFSRHDPEEIPKLWWLKESGDIENEARLVILARRLDAGMVSAYVAKSTFGDEGATVFFARTPEGTLKEVRP